MGACASCLRGRNKTASHDRSELDPLLPVGNDNDMDTTDAADQQSQQRQQELSHIVQTAHEFLIDIPSVDGPEQVEPTDDVADLIESLKTRLDDVQSRVPESKDLTPAQRQELESELHLASTK